MFLKKLMSHKLIVDRYCPDNKMYIVFYGLEITMSPKSYKRWYRLKQSPLLRSMYAEL